MQDNFDTCLALILKEEGGYVNNPRDPGGMTNLGVTKAVLESYLGHPVDETYMKAMTRDTVSPIYKTNYWDMCHGDTLPHGIDYAVLDLAVNSGVSRAIKFLQEVVGAKVDGVLGPRTLDQVEASVHTSVVTDLCERRLNFLQGLPTFNTFGKGWTDRVHRVEKIAFDMASR